jgi:hypothetical protein
MTGVRHLPPALAVDVGRAAAAPLPFAGSFHGSAAYVERAFKVGQIKRAWRSIFGNHPECQIIAGLKRVDCGMTAFIGPSRRLLPAMDAYDNSDCLSDLILERR